MSEFDKVIGYSKEKEELTQICDMLKNKDVYERLGAKMPRGVLIEGAPGVGKTLMATSFLKESGVKGYIVRRSKKNGDFVANLERIFEEAAKNQPAVILLDDMDKFATDEDDKEGYIAVQTCIDSVNGKDVLVVATANSTREFPKSLLRAGRFDRQIHMEIPKGEDARRIINHYMDEKKFPAGMDRDDVVKMLDGHTCAEIETLINEAAALAGYERCESVGLDHIVKTYIKFKYKTDVGEEPADRDELEKVAYHEAGHLLLLDYIAEGGVGLACIRGDETGFVKRYKTIKRRPHEILIVLGGKAAAELKYGWIASGAQSDIRKATNLVSDAFEDSAIGGFSLSYRMGDLSENLNSRRDAAIGARLEEYLYKAKEIIAANMDYLDGLAKALMEKRFILNSEIKKIRESVTIKKVDIA